MPTYIYLGHGSECVIDEVAAGGGGGGGGAAAVKKIPDRTKVVQAGSTLSTITESGAPSIIYDITRLRYLSSAHSTRALMASPVENYDILSSIFGGLNNKYLRQLPNYLPIYNINQFRFDREGHEQYHLKVEGQVYSDRSFDFLLYRNLDSDPVILLRSGIYEIENPNYPSLHLPIEATVSKTEADLSVANFLALYEGSVYPTTAEITDYIVNNLNIDILSGKLSYLNVLDIALHFKQKQSELLERFPGNHYNFTCRSYTNSVNKNTRRRVRRNSLNIISALPRPMYDKLLLEYNPNLGVLVNQINLIINKAELKQVQKNFIKKSLKFLAEKIREGDDIIELKKELGLQNSSHFIKDIEKARLLELISEEDLTVLVEGLATKGGRRQTRRRKSRRSGRA